MNWQRNISHGPHDDRIIFCFIIISFPRGLCGASHVSGLQFCMNATQRRSVFVTFFPSVFRHLQVENSWTPLRFEWGCDVAPFEGLFQPSPLALPLAQDRIEN